MKIFICPALMDWLIFLILFAVLYAAGERHCSMMECAWIGGVFQIVYMVASFLLGLTVNRRNARAFLMISVMASAVFASLCLWVTDFKWVLLTMALFGMFAAMFFNSFQTFMGGESPPGGLTRTVGLYTLAWSLGASFGLISSGALYTGGMGVLTGVTVLVCSVMFVILKRHQASPGSIAAADAIEESADDMRKVNPAYVWVGWTMIFTAMLVQRPVHTFFPSLSAVAGVSSFVAGLLLFMNMAMQGLIGAAMIRFRPWLYRRTPILGVNVLAILVLLGLWKWPATWMTAIGFCLFGVYLGASYFSAVFYSLNSLRRAFNVGVNEFLVGLGSFMGIFIIEWIMKQVGDPQSMYLGCAGILALSTLVQMALPSCHPARER